MIAAERTGRQARLLELDPRYADVIVVRWQCAAAKVAVHAATGKEFPSVTAYSAAASPRRPKS